MDSPVGVMRLALPSSRSSAASAWLWQVAILAFILARNDFAFAVSFIETPDK